MATSPSRQMQLHTDSAKFLEVITYTSKITGFSARMIERDYYCSLALHYLNTHGDGLRPVFKGGTCICKVYAGFYRVSEDLDFMMSLGTDSTRGDRRRAIKPIKEQVARMGEHLPCFKVTELHGHDESRQYNGCLTYKSVVTGLDTPTKVEISLREPVLEPGYTGVAQTLLMDPQTGSPLVDGFNISALTHREVYVEKFRAALVRREPAIRDIYDVSTALEAGLDMDSPEFLGMMRRKLAMPGTGPMTLFGEAAGASLKTQLEEDLLPVLAPEAHHGFNLDETVQRLRAFVQAHGLVAAD